MAELRVSDTSINQENRKTSFFRGCWDYRTRPDVYQMHRFDRIGVTWTWIIVFFTIVLLFGSPIQFLFTTKDADIVFDVLYIIALGVFVMDMILSMLGDPLYFGFSLFHRVEVFDQPKLCTYGIGSFRMWCDVVSTATLFYDISYTNSFHYGEEVVELTLDQHGLVVSLYDFASSPGIPTQHH
jgi:hypothetical protein